MSILAANKRRFGKGDSSLPVGTLDDGNDLLLHAYFSTVLYCTIVRACAESIRRSGNFIRKSMFTHRFLETMLSVATAFKRMYLWNWTSYEAGLWLILKLINCTLTWNNKRENRWSARSGPFSQILSNIVVTFAGSAVQRSQ